MSCQNKDSLLKQLLESVSDALSLPDLQPNSQTLPLPSTVLMDETQSKKNELNEVKFCD